MQVGARAPLGRHAGGGRRAAAALPGSTTAETAPALGDAWATGVGRWADEVVTFSASVERLEADAAATDDAAAGALLGTGLR